jgi:dihydrofolate synthase/folylpolyglutamate synthase
VEAGKITEGFAMPADAFARAQERAAVNDRIVVFGSFLTVADVLAQFKAAADARHSIGVSR